MLQQRDSMTMEVCYYLEHWNEYVLVGDTILWSSSEHSMSLMHGRCDYQSFCSNPAVDLCFFGDVFSLVCVFYLLFFLFWAGLLTLILKTFMPSITVFEKKMSKMHGWPRHISASSWLCGTDLVCTPALCPTVRQTRRSHGAVWTYGAPTNKIREPKCILRACGPTWHSITSFKATCAFYSKDNVQAVQCTILTGVVPPKIIFS